MKRLNDNKPHTLKLKQEYRASGKEGDINFQKLNPLGGVYLYNQKYKRYLATSSGCDDNQGIFKSQSRDQRSSFNRNSEMNKENEHIEQQTIEFMKKSQCQEVQNPINFTQQIETIIQQFKSSQINTVMFLEQIKKSKTDNNNQNQISFDELLQFYRSQRGKKYSQIISRIYKQCKVKMNQEIERLKDGEVLKMQKKHQSLMDFSTQTYNDHYEVENIKSLRKQLLKKEAEYSVLYDYKIKLLNDSQQINKYNEDMIKDQRDRIKKLQSESISHQYEKKSLQKQLKQLQGRLIEKIAQLQRESTSNNKSEISSLNLIDQAIVEDTVTKFVELRTQIQKKKRYKHRAQSLFLATKSFIGAHQNELFASLTSIGSQSMKQMADQFAKQLQQIDQKENGSTQRGRRNQMQRSSLLKILQKYLDKKEKRKDGSFINDIIHSKANSKTKLKSILSRKSTSRKTSQVKSNNGLELIDKNNIQQTLETLFKKNKKEAIKVGNKKQRRSEIIKVGKRINIEEETKENSGIKKFKKTTQFSKGQNCGLRNIKYPLNENTLTKQGAEHLNQSFTQKSDNVQNHLMNQNRSQQITKREKKIVNFRLKIYRQQNLRINSHQISICIQGRNKTSRTHSLLRSSISADRLNQKLLRGFNYQKGENQLLHDPLNDKKHHKMLSIIEQKPIQGFEFEQGQNEDNLKYSWGQQQIMPIYSANKQRESHKEVSTRKKSNLASKSKDNNQVMASRGDMNKFAESQYLQKAKIAASLCKNKQQYQIELKRLHKGCGPNCSHVQRYVDSFDKFKVVKKQMMKVKVENLNNNISFNCANLSLKNK